MRYKTRSAAEQFNISRKTRIIGVLTGRVYVTYYRSFHLLKRLEITNKCLKFGC